MQGSDRLANYPTNVSNMTHDQIVMSSDVGSQAYKCSTGPEPVVSNFNNEFNSSGFNWRHDKLYQPSAQAMANDFMTSQERNINKFEHLDQILQRSRSRELQ